MKAPARSFADLEVWKNANSFVLEMYRLTGDSRAMNALD